MQNFKLHFKIIVIIAVKSNIEWVINVIFDKLLIARLQLQCNCSLSFKLNFKFKLNFDSQDSTLCKLRFVLGLVECVLDLAESRRKLASHKAEEEEEEDEEDCNMAAQSASTKAKKDIAKRSTWCHVSHVELNTIIFII